MAKTPTSETGETVAVVEPGQSIESAIVQAQAFEDAVSGTTDMAIPDEAPSNGAVVYSQQAEFERNEVSLPRLRLAQGQTLEVQEGTAKPGDWILMGEEPLSTVTIIPVMFGRERVMVDDPRANRPNVLCSSPDAKIGVGTPGGNCATCPMAQWTDNPANGKGEKPRCGLIYHYLSYVVEYGQLVDLQLKGTGTVAARYINTMINARGLGRFAIELSSKSAQNGSRTYYVPTASLTQATPEDLEIARDFASAGVE